MLEPGAMIAGKLRVERVLGKGGMGTVVVATHVGLDQRVAIKILHAELANQSEVVARFVREARASAKLRSEHVCRVSDVSNLETGEPYIEMELLDGQDMQSLIESGGPLSVETAADYVVQACVAVAEAHQLGIIHRDLKPANLFVTRRLDGSALVKVLDFGIATAPSADDFKITKTTTVMGSPGYMSPEHLRSARDVDARSDIWALGVILYEAVTARLPFVATSITELAVKVVMDDPEPLTGVDPRFAAIVMKCLMKDPAKRYQNVAELANELAPLGSASAHASAILVAKLLPGSKPYSIPASASSSSSSPIALAPTGISSSGPIVPPQTTLHGASGSTTTAPASRRKHPALIATGVLVFLGAGAAAMVLLTRGGGGKTTVHDAAPIAVVAPPDVASVMPSPPTDALDPELADLQALAQTKDWAAMLTLAKHHADDPAIAPQIAEAKQAYTAQQTVEIADYAKRGDCGSAKTTAKVATELVPENAAAFDKAATCAPKVKPVQASLDDQASDAYDKEQYPRAMQLAQQALQKDAKDAEALRIAARTACQLKDAEQAKKLIAELDPRDRKAPEVVCQLNKVSLAPPPPKPPVKPPEPPKPPEPAKLDIPKELEFAKQSMKAQNYTNGLSAAQKILAVDPDNLIALQILGNASCHLHQVAQGLKAADRIQKTRPLQAARIRRICANPGAPQPPQQGD